MKSDMGEVRSETRIIDGEKVAAHGKNGVAIYPQTRAGRTMHASTVGGTCPIGVARNTRNDVAEELSFHRDCYAEEDRDAWDAQSYLGAYRVCVNYRDDYCTAYYTSRAGLMETLFSYSIDDVADCDRLLQKRDRCTSARECIDAEIRRLRNENLRRAFLAARVHHQGYAGRVVQPILEVAPDVRDLMTHVEVLSRIGPEAAIIDADRTRRIWVGEGITGTYVIQENVDFGPCFWLVKKTGEVVAFQDAVEMKEAIFVHFVTVNESDSDVFCRIREYCRKNGA